jgi:membrane protein DedA with SNARE-associated domain
MLLAVLASVGKQPAGLSLFPVWTQHFLQSYGVLALFTLIFLQDSGIPTLVPGTLLVLVGGYLAYEHLFDLNTAAVAVALGAFLGASLLFFIARRGGRPLTLYLGKFVGLSEKQFDVAAHALDRWGPGMLLVTRVAPGTRVYMTAFAGISGWTYRRFAIWTAIFSVAWAYTFVLLGYALGPRWDSIAPQINHYSNLFITIISILLIVALVAFIARVWRLNRKQGVSQSPIALTPAPASQPRAATTATTALKEQPRAHSSSGGRRILRVADDATSRQKWPHRRRR